MAMEPFLSRALTSSRTKRILAYVAFNLLLEFWVHGLAEFTDPVLVVSLFLMYLSYFLILADLVARLNLRDHHVLLVAFVYGMMQETLTTGSVFNDAFVLGINPRNVLMASTLWWGILQSVLAYYFANTVVEGREQESDKMGLSGWSFAIGINAFFFLLPAIEDNYPDGTMAGYVTSLILVLTALAILVLLRKPKHAAWIERVRPVDALLRIQCLVCLPMGILNTFVLGDIAVYLFAIWSTLMGIVYVALVARGHRFVGQNRRRVSARV